MSLAKKLKLYRKELHQQNKVSQKLREDTDTAGYAQKVRDEEMRRAADQFHADIRGFDDQYVFVHTERLPLHLNIGPHVLTELESTVSDWQAVPFSHPLSARGLQPEDLLFFDTETTGLASGTGQMIFLIGLARWTREGVELKQYFLPGPGHEAAFYHAFLSDNAALKNLVTFNGKAFDWPRVKTRHQFVRDQVPKLPAFGHFDLLHSARRLWKNRLESVRLQTVEEEILGMGRTRDVPGKMAPFLYFQFLKHPDAALVKGIIEHNREDVLTLISLYIHLSNKLLGKSRCDDGEQYEIARWYEQIGEWDHARSILKTLTDRQCVCQKAAKCLLARIYKREGAYTQALAMLRSAIEDDENERELYIEAAKLLEHQFKDYGGALDYTKRALNILRRGGSKQAEETEYLRRLNRLDQRVENYS